MKKNEISYFEHELIMSKLEKKNRRLSVLCGLIFFGLLATNAAFVVRMLFF